MVKDIDLIVSLSDELFQLVQLRLVTKVTAIKAAIISWGPTRERNRWKQKKHTLHYIYNELSLKRYRNIIKRKVW